MRISDWSSDVCSSDLHIFGFKTGRKAFQFPPLQGFMACGEALLVAILPRKQRIDGMPFGGISGDCGSVAHQPRFGLWRNAGCEGGLIVHRPPSIDKVKQIARSEARRVGQVDVRTSRYRGWA